MLNGIAGIFRIFLIYLISYSTYFLFLSVLILFFLSNTLSTAGFIVTATFLITFLCSSVITNIYCLCDFGGLFPYREKRKEIRLILKNKKPSKSRFKTIFSRKVNILEED